MGYSIKPEPTIDWEERAKAAEARIQNVKEGIARAMDLLEDKRSELHKKWEQQLLDIIEALLTNVKNNLIQ